MVSSLPPTPSSSSSPRPSLSLVDAYESLLVHNLSTVNTVESAIRNVTWFLPGRFADAELASEGLYALLSVVSSYHDTLLARRLPRALALPPHPFAKPPAPAPVPTSGRPSAAFPRVTPVLPPPSEHARYTRYWTARSGAYRRAARALTTLGYVQLLVEMVMKKRGDRARWRTVLGLEWTKAVLRLLLLAITKRSVLHHPCPQREYDLASLPLNVLDGNAAAASPASSPATASTEETGNILPTAQPLIPTIRAHAPLRAHLYPLTSALPDSYLAHPLTLLPELDAKGYAAEALGILASLVQVLLLLRASRRYAYRPLSLPTLSSSLSPFLPPLVLSLLARQLRAPAQTTLQFEHNATTDRRMASRFFLTGPVWVGWTRPKVMAVVAALERVPLIGLAGELVEAYIPLVDDYFYYTAS
ncbi:hypothetical protein Q5752_001003 [Cryptotrichosporon argae]